jgi:hypothetical protein
VSGLVVEFAGQVDYLDGVERTLLDADTTGLSEADLLADADLIGLTLLWVVASQRDTLLTGAVWWAVVLALVVAPIRLAAVKIDDGDTVVSHSILRWSATRSK